MQLELEQYHNQFVPVGLKTIAYSITRDDVFLKTQRFYNDRNFGRQTIQDDSMLIQTIRILIIFLQVMNWIVLQTKMKRTRAVTAVVSTGMGTTGAIVL